MPTKAQAAKKRDARDPLIGKRFRSTIADCSCLFEVVRSESFRSYVCVVINEPVSFEGRTFDSDYAGQQRFFSKKNVAEMVCSTEHYERMRNAHNGFYETLPVGSIAHYHYGFNCFFRCEVVQLTTERVVGMDLFPAGSKALKLIAFVGPWHDNDLMSASIYTRQIQDGHLIRPHVSNVFEAPSFSHPGMSDPRKMIPRAITGQRNLFV